MDERGRRSRVQHHRSEVLGIFGGDSLCYNYSMYIHIYVYINKYIYIHVCMHACYVLLYYIKLN